MDKMTHLASEENKWFINKIDYDPYGLFPELLLKTFNFPIYKIHFIWETCTPAHSSKYPVSQSYDTSAMH